MVFRMTDLEETEEKRTVAEFCHLFEKSKQLFNGLRDLPPYGHKQWQNYFGRAFDVYTRLWKFQQQHRPVLDKKYMLKRWQIGEIASRIAQLYYHYYLRTSETNYLNEAFQFYGAIKARGYYSKWEERPDLTVKKLRYYARFIVVCLLLRRMKNVRELVRDLAQHVEEYKAIEPDEELEWSLVISEIRSFIEADSPVAIFDSTGEKLVLTFRLAPTTSFQMVDKSPNVLVLQEALIVGSKGEQARFSELTIDMYRILQTLEREPQDERNASIPCLRRENPHKYLLYNPTVETLLVYMGAGLKDVESGGVFLMYLSGDPLAGDNVGEVPGYDAGGVSTLKFEETRCAISSRKVFGEPRKCFHPGDIIPFTRKPLFLIVESENADVFQDVQSPFGMPLVVFMSPRELPQFFNDNPPGGSLLTLFLHCPLSGFCVLTGIDSLTSPLWDAAQGHVDKFLTLAYKIVMESNCDTSYIDFLGDDFLRSLILRFIFYKVLLRSHRACQLLAHHPRAQPDMPWDQIHVESLSRIILDLADHLSVIKMFTDLN